MPAIDAIGTVAVSAAIQAAQTYLRRHCVVVPDEDLVTALRSAIKDRLPEALRDAKEALDAGMSQVAEATFAASMCLAGYEAARQCIEKGLSAPCPM